VPRADDAGSTRPSSGGAGDAGGPEDPAIVDDLARLVDRAPLENQVRPVDRARDENPARDAGPAILPFGDNAVLLDLREPPGIRAARRAQALARAVAALRETDSRLRAPVPGAASVLVPFDDAETDVAEVAARLAPLLAALPVDPPPPGDAREHLVPVRYGSAQGPDLQAVAAAAGLSPDEVVALHSGTAFEVLFLGFAPGFAYLGDLPEPLVTPRLATPRIRVPAGSVAIADRFTAVYPAASPGGWRLIGRTDLTLFDPADDPPTLLRPGDRVRFVPA
jgi:5-oxoprolinase (ATP-hydrolysing) subunit B